jgi:hypothetical protein
LLIRNQAANLTNIADTARLMTAAGRGSRMARFQWGLCRDQRR